MGPFGDVVPFAVLRRVRTPGKRTSAVPGDQRHGLSAGRDPPGPAHIQHATGGVEDDGDDLRLGRKLQHFGTGDQGSVGGLAVAEFAEEIVQPDGDDDGGGDATGGWGVPGFQEPVAHVFEGVMHPLPTGTGIRLTNTATGLAVAARAFAVDITHISRASRVNRVDRAG